MKSVREAAIAIVILPMRIYRIAISPLLPPACRFTPTCSQYFIEAVQKWGVIVGTFKGVRRLLRCHPFGGSGYDPV